MDARELLAASLENSLYQVEKVYEGLTDFDYKVTPQAMSPKEILAHFCEVCVAVMTEIKGGTHSWGSYTPPSTEPSKLLSTYRELRAEATEAALLLTDPKLLIKANGFLSQHESYHIGQLCLARMALDPKWNAYSIYKM